MANEQNLIPGQHKLTVEEQSKAGIKSGEARRRKRTMRQCFTELAKMSAPDKVKDKIKKAGLEVPDDLNMYEALTYSMMMKAISGDSRMVSQIMDVMGEKNSDKLKEKELRLREKELQKGRSEAIDRLDDILRGLKNAAETDEETE